MIETFSTDPGDCNISLEFFRKLPVTIQMRLLIRLRSAFRNGHRQFTNYLVPNCRSAESNSQINYYVLTVVGNP